MSEAYIYDAVRTPRGKGKKNGSLHAARPVELARTVLQALQTRNQLDTNAVEDVIFGCVTPVAEQGANIAKVAASFAGYPDTVAGVTINRFCASGLEAVNQAASYVKAGYSDLLVAGGVESMSRIAMASDGGAWAIDPEVANALSFVPQGISADLIATRSRFNREQLDQFAAESHQKAALAWQEGRFGKSIIPVLNQHGTVLLAQDELLRADTTAASLGSLKPAFEQMGEQYGFDAVALQRYPTLEKIHHVHHAGNSSGIVDGAAAVLIGSATAGQKQGLKPRARIRAMAITSTEPTIMLTGPVPATHKVLQKAGLTLKDIDLIEINEAFAAVVMYYLQELNLSPEKVNVNGGAIALGHPLGATGAMLLGTVLDELERQDKQLGLVTLCIGGGMGIATIIERV